MLGAIIGDIVGSRWEFNPTNDYHFELFSDNNDFTDDTICTIAVADALLNGKPFGDTIHAWCRRYPYPMGSYGGSFHLWVKSDRPKPYGSFGNGSAMRVSPVGWFYRDQDEQDLLAAAAASAACTHNHPEGIKGAQTVALAISHCSNHFCYRGSKMNKETILEALQPALRFSKYDIHIDKKKVQNRFDETCQGTVPVALWLISESTSFEDAIRKAISLGADADTLGAIVGSIAEAIWGIPEEIKERALTYLPDEMKIVYDNFYKRVDIRPAGTVIHPRWTDPGIITVIPATNKDLDLLKKQRKITLQTIKRQSTEFERDKYKTKQDYLQDKQVSQFIQWMAERIDQPQTFKYYHEKSKQDWECSSIFNAYEKYEWKGIQFPATEEHLSKCLHNLQEALKDNNDDACIKACESILEWGGVLRGNMAKLERLQEEGLVKYLSKVKELLTSEEPDFSGIVMSSGFSKIYSLLLDRFIIYDIRVAAALGYFIRLYCEERHLPEVPNPLQFACCASRGTHHRNPSKDPYRFPIMQPNKYSMHNLRASWLLEEVVNKPSHRFYQLPEKQRLRALEAALFMIGYELPE